MKSLCVLDEDLLFVFSWFTKAADVRQRVSPDALTGGELARQKSSTPFDPDSAIFRIAYEIP